MANQMLVDATHPEETRVVVVRGNRVEEFDFESANRKQLRGNIYLAKVTRVEPSLQAAFVDYGGNRHGFLAFSEIHPDYYQIPVADRQALLEEEKGLDEDDGQDAPAPSRRSNRNRKSERVQETKQNESEQQPAVELDEDAAQPEVVTQPETAAEEAPVAADAESPNDQAPEVEAAQEPVAEIEQAPQEQTENDETAEDDKTPPAQAHAVADEDEKSADPDDIEEAEELDDDEHVSFDRSDDDEDDEHGDEDGDVEQVGAEDALEELPERRTRRRAKQYKIQEVIKRRQILLVQVVKEERGNKGAALTTYLSLAGRYSVLMPNTARGGGISRKITNVSDRKRLIERIILFDSKYGLN